MNKAQLIDFLLATHQDVDTLLVFATSDEAQPSVPQIQVWWLEEGKIAPLIPESDLRFIDTSNFKKSLQLLMVPMNHTSFSIKKQGDDIAGVGVDSPGEI